MKKLFALVAVVVLAVACSSVNQSITKDQSLTNTQMQQYQAV